MVAAAAAAAGVRVARRGEQGGRRRLLRLRRLRVGQLIGSPFVRRSGRAGKGRARHTRRRTSSDRFREATTVWTQLILAAVLWRAVSVECCYLSRESACS